MADVLFQNLPSQSIVAPSHEILLDNGLVTGRATISKVIDLLNNSGSINTLTSSGSINIKSNSDSSGGGDINFLVGNNILNNKIKSNANGTQGLFEVVETHVSSSFLSSSVNSVGLGARENQLFRIDDNGKTGQILCSDDWSEPKGGYLFDGVNDYVSIPYTQKTKSIGFWIYPTTTNKAILNFGTNLQITFNSSNVLTYGTGITNSTTYVNCKPTTQLTLNVWQFVFIVFDEITPTVLEIGRYSTSYFTGKLILTRTFNRALTQAEVISLYNNGLIGQNTLPIADVGANNTNIIPSASSTFDTDGTAYWDNTAGRGTVTWDNVGFSLKYIANGTSGNNYILRSSLLNRAKKYNLKFILKSPTATNVPSINFGSGITTVLAPNCSTDYQQYEYIISNTLYSDLSITFGVSLANLTEYYVDDIVLTQIGCIAEYLPENAGCIGWIETMNGLHGSTSGSPVCLTAEQGSQIYKDYKSTVTGNTTLTSIIPKRYILKQIIIENTTANTFTLNIGSSTSGGTDVVNGASIVSGITTITINKTFSLTTDQTLYLQSSNWNSSSNNFYFIMEKI